MSRKQEIYAEMLRWSIPYIRDVQAQGSWHRMKDRSCLLEAQLLHALPNSILEPDFVDNDVWFLNHHARDYVGQSSAGISKVYAVNYRLIQELFTLVPPQAREKLTWSGPPEKV